ncbi:major facilitator superfamily domain-containing protein [Pilobolus umbonatus]|nr:major facilitator superfamily domain-containing protein [Pilobolus umbonatus]
MDKSSINIFNVPVYSIIHPSFPACDSTMNEHASLLRNSKQSIRTPSPWYAIFPMCLVAISGGALFAPHVQFYTEIFCDRYYNSHDTLSPNNCNIPEVHKMVSRAQAVIMFLNYGSTLLTARFYGRMSDRKGRISVFRISTIGSLLYVFCDIITARYSHHVGIYLLFLGPFLKGIMAGDSVLMANVQAYIADTTSSADRTMIFARLMAILFMGSSIGPLVGSFILKHTGSIVYIFYFAFIVDLLNVVYTSFILKESNKKNASEEVLDTTDRRCSFSISSVFGILFKTKSPHLSANALLFIALAEFLLTLVKRPPTLLYAMLKFKWTAYEGSLYLTAASFTRLIIVIIVLPLLLKLFTKRCPRSNMLSITREKQYKSTVSFDIWMVRIGIGIDVVCLALAGLATSAVLFATAGILQSFSMLCQPSIRSLLTTSVDPRQVGELMGAVAMLDALAMIISHLGINTLYSATVSTMPNVTFFVCAIIAAFSCTSSFFVKVTDCPRHTVDITKQTSCYSE